jgi:hypothetical protein
MSCIHLVLRRSEWLSGWHSQVFAQGDNYVKIKLQPGIVFMTLLLAAISSLTGCATTANDRAVPVQIDVSRAALDDLVKPSRSGMERGVMNKVSATGCELKLRTKEQNDHPRDIGVSPGECSGNQR